MATEPGSRGWMQPRGDDASQSGQPRSAPPLSSSGGSGSGVDPQSGQGFHPGTGAPNGTTDNFGNAIPDQGSGGLDDGSGGQTFDPPSSHVS